MHKKLNRKIILPAVIVLAGALAYCGSNSGSSSGGSGDSTKPEINSISPTGGSVSVNRGENIVITFSEALKAATLGSVTFTSPAVAYTDGVNATITVSGSSVTVNPTELFDNTTTYTGIAVAGFADLSGNVMTDYSDAAYTFTTADQSSQVAQPVITLSNNTYDSTLVTSQNVTITTATSGAVIKYTTDGSVPSATNGTVYSVPFKVDSSLDVNAYATCSGYIDSDLATQAVDGTVELTSEVTDWRDEILYFMLTDRFNDGDSSNDSQMSSSYDGGDYVAGDGKKYQGGDFAGITAKLDYLQDLGITAIWITAPVKQAWNNAGYTSYHGYWAQDFLSVDPHLGTLEDFKKLVYEAHKRDIKVVMDVVINHMGSLFYYDLNSNSSPDSGEWEPTFNSSGTYSLAWLDSFDWGAAANRVKPMPVEFQNPNWFTRKGGNATTGSGDEITQGDFAGLRDVNTLNSDVKAKMIEIFKWWVKHTNIDGFRIDTVKHVESAFWTDFCGTIRTWAASSAGGNKNFYMVAEVYDGSASGLGTYTTSNMLDSVLGFSMADEVFDWNSGDNITVFKDAGTWSARPKTNTLESALSSIAADSNLNANSIHTDGDGLTARQKIGYFLDNHDLNRFLNGTSGTSNVAASSGEISNLQTALAWLLTWEGIPVIYYGTEQNYKQSLALSNHGEQGDGDGNCEKGNRPRLWEIKNSNNSNTAFDETNSTFKLIQGLTSLRKTYAELSKGVVSVRWADDGTSGATADDGIIAYVKKGYTASVDDDILVVINTNTSQVSAASAGSGNDMGVDWPVGTVLETVQIPGFDSAQPTVSVYDSGSSSWVDVTTVTTYSQSGKTSAVYFKVPANSIRIFKKQ